MRVPLSVADKEGVREAVKVVDGLEEAEGLLVADFEGSTEGVGAAPVTLAPADALCGAVARAEGVLAAVPEGHAPEGDGDAVPIKEREPRRDAEGSAEPVREPLGEPLPLRDPPALREALWHGAPDPEARLLADTSGDLVALEETLALREGSAPLFVGAPLLDKVIEVSGVKVESSEADALPVADGEAPAVRVSLAGVPVGVVLPEAPPLWVGTFEPVSAAGVGVSAPSGGEGVSAPVREPSALAVEDGQGRGVGVGRGLLEGLALRGAEADAPPDPLGERVPVRPSDGVGEASVGSGDAVLSMPVPLGDAVAALDAVRVCGRLMLPLDVLQNREVSVGAPGEAVGGSPLPVGEMEALSVTAAERLGDAEADEQGVPEFVDEGEGEALLVGVGVALTLGDALAVLLVEVEGVMRALREGEGGTDGELRMLGVSRGEAEREGEPVDDGVVHAVGCDVWERGGDGEGPREAVTPGDAENDERGVRVREPADEAEGARGEAEAEPEGAPGLALGLPPLGVAVEPLDGAPLPLRDG